MSKNPTVYRADYLPPTWLVDTVNLVVDLQGPEQALVEARFSIRPNHQATPGPLFFNGEAIDKLEGVWIDEKVLDSSRYTVDEKGLTIAELPAGCELKTLVRINPKGNTALSGLYLDGGGMFCTQMEAEGFRRFTFFPDRPDVQSIWTCKIIADKTACPVLLANGNLVDSGDLPDGRHFVVWHDPHRKPCYLFALVGGQLSALEDHFVTASGRKVQLKIFSQAANMGKVGWAMDSLKRAMRWDEEAFGREYDLDIFMIVATDYFNFGAMENKGLNIFNASALLATPETTTDARYFRIEGIVAHEYFHNWSGNRVTCRSWFELSLKEGFTVLRDNLFSIDQHDAEVQRIEDVAAFRAMQFPEDSGPMAHPIRPDSYEAIDNFYTATVYEKGAEVIRMMRVMAGNERFRKGCDLYFERHDGQAATCEDFIRAIEEGAGLDLGQFRRWYEQAGTPEVVVDQSYDRARQELRLRFRQSCPPTPGQSAKPEFHIPIKLGLLAPAAQGYVEIPVTPTPNRDWSPDTQVFHLRSTEATLVCRQVPPDSIPSLLRGFSAPVKLHVVDQSNQALRIQAQYDTDGFGRSEAINQLAVRVLRERIEGGTNAAGSSAWAEYREACAFILGAVLAGTMSPALAATMIGLPDELYLRELLLKPLDLGRIQEAYELVLKDLAKGLDWAATYDHCQVPEAYRPEGAQAGRRSLRNLALRMLVRLGQIDRASDQFRTAANMTDASAALAALCDLVGGPATEAALDQFRKRWEHDDLMMDTWFGLQAGSRLGGGLERVQRLEQDRRFDWKRPNSVRALAGSFTRSGVHNFDHPDGSGYAYYAQMLITLDALNPSTAGRMAKALNGWRQLDIGRQQRIKVQLQRIIDERGLALSANLREVVTKGLAD